MYERALSELPGSYKLWKQYLDIRREKLKGLNAVRHKSLYNAVIALYERALVLLNKVIYYENNREKYFTYPSPFSMLDA